MQLLLILLEWKHAQTCRSQPGEQLNHVIALSLFQTPVLVLFVLVIKKHLFMLTQIILDDAAVGMTVKNHSPKTIQMDENFKKF